MWYTDAYHWDQQEPDQDAKWTDDWDVDMSIYDDPKAGDMDARDMHDIRRFVLVNCSEI